MRIAVYIAACALVVLPQTLSAQGPGGLNSGGGTRSGNGIRVVDAVGTAFAGDAAGSEHVASSGFISGLPIVTPVTLRTFHVEVGELGVLIRWEAAEQESRFSAFYLERAEGAGESSPSDEDYVRYNTRFSGVGPHEYLDSLVEIGRTYYYRLIWMSNPRAPDTIGPWSVYIDPSAAPKPIEIYSAYPNPFQDAFVVSLFLSEPAPVGWSLHDVQGRVVLRGGKSQVPAGFYSQRVSPLRPLRGGVYFLRVTSKGKSHVQKIIALP